MSRGMIGGSSYLDNVGGFRATTLICPHHVYSAGGRRRESLFWKPKVSLPAGWGGSWRVKVRLHGERKPVKNETPRIDGERVPSTQAMKTV